MQERINSNNKTMGIYTRLRTISKFFIIGEKKRNYKKIFVKSIFILFIMLYPIDLTIGLLYKDYEPNEYGDREYVAYKINRCRELFEQNPDKYKIIIFGDSRTMRDVVPALIDERLNDTTISYNLGITGLEIKIEKFFIENIILKKLKPDLIIWEINYADFKKTMSDSTHIVDTPMYRYYTGDFVNNDFYDYLDYFLLKTSNIYRYRSYLIPYSFKIRATMNEINNAYDPLFLNSHGFLKGNKVYEDYPYPDGVIKDKIPDLVWDETQEIAFNDTLNLLNSGNCDYLIFYGPFHYVKIILPQLDELIKSIPEDNFINFNGATRYAKKEYCYDMDTYHMNYKGAYFLTQELLQYILNFKNKTENN